MTDQVTSVERHGVAYPMVGVDGLPGAIQKQLDGTEDELRAFLKTDVQKAWFTDLRISVVRTLTNAGTAVQAGAQKALDTSDIDAYLTFLNEGLYAARAVDCAAQPTATPTVTPSASATATPGATPTATPGATETAAPAPTSSDDAGAPGGGGGLPVTGADTRTLAVISGALLLLGAAGYLIGRRRRSRFVA